MRTALTDVIGSELMHTIMNSKIFVVGSGAIGCELLKNLAMLSLGAEKDGMITVTDPDHIESSNITR